MVSRIDRATRDRGRHTDALQGGSDKAPVENDERMPRVGSNLKH
jgi:hypothetical protein